MRDPTIKWCKQQGIENIRCYFGPGLSTGWPDDIILIPGGRPLFIEFKAPGGKASPRQKKKHKILRNNGYGVEVCGSREKAIRVITEAIQASGKTRGWLI